MINLVIKAKEKPIKLLIYIFIISLIFGVSGIFYAKHVEDKEFITLYGTENNKTPDQDFTNTEWGIHSDPIPLISYCNTQFRKDSSQRTCILASGSHDQAKVFSNALWEGWSGHTQSARHKFNLLQFHENKIWSLWGGIGLLELENYTGDQSAVASLLQRLKEDFTSSEKPLLIEAYEYYELWYASNNYEWVRLKKLLRKYSKKQVRNDAELLYLQSSIFYANGQEPELEKLLNEASPTLKRTNHYINSMLLHTSLKFGQKEEDYIISKLAAIRPDDVGIIGSNAAKELLDDDPDVVEAALYRIAKIAVSSKNNVDLVLMLSVIVAAYGKPDESIKIFKLGKFNDVVLEDFAMYHIFIAWKQYYKEYDYRKYDVMRSSLDKALSLAPRNIGASRLMVIYAEYFERPDLALKSLETMLDFDPYNEINRGIISRFRTKFKTPEIEAVYQRMINHH